ncbi:hypothetical protein MTO96_040298 [Rhipicephalus appendiculatus]
MIPELTVLLPCSHNLCTSCHAANSHGWGGRCPLDQEPFEEIACVDIDFTTTESESLEGLLLERDSWLRVQGSRGRCAEAFRERMYIPLRGVLAMRRSSTA